MADNRKQLEQELERLRLADELEALRAQEPKEDTMGAIGAGLEQLGRAASFNLADRVGAGVDVLANMLPNETDEQLKAQGFNIQQQDPTYAEALAARRQREEMQKEEFPTATTVGDIAGTLAGGVGLGGKVAQGLAKVPALAGSGLGNAVLKTGLEGAAIGAAAGIDPALSGKISAIPQEAAIGGVVSAAFPVAGSLIRGASKALLRTATGVTDEAINAYLANPVAAESIKDASAFSEELKDRALGILGEVKRNAQETRMETVDAVQEALNRMKQRVVERSAESYEILGKSAAKLTNKEAKDIVNRSIVNLGKPFGSAAKSAQASLENLKKDLDLYPEVLSGTELKDIVQKIDGDVGALNSAAGGFIDSPTTRGLLDIRKGFDQVLKGQSPEYAAKMKEVANEAGLLKEASRAWGKPESAESAISRLGKPKEEIKDVKFKEFLKGSDIDPQRVKESQETARLFESWNKENIGTKLEKLGSKNADSVKQQFKILSEIGDTDFEKQAELLRVATHFESTFLRGSRNTNLWGVIGAAATSLPKAGIGTALGTVGMGPVGAAVGASVGAFLDIYGPKVAKKVLSQVATIRGMPTIEKIGRLDLPGGVIKNLQDQLRQFVTASSVSGEPTYIPPEQRASMAYDIETSKTLTDVEKARELSSLNKDGTVKEMRKIALGAPVKEVPPVVFNPKPKPAVRVEDVADQIRLKRKEPKF